MLSPKSFFRILQFGFPKTVKIAVFIDCQGFSVASADQSLWSVFKIDTNAAILCFNINEGNMMLRQHRMRFTSDLDLDLASVKTGYNRNMLFLAGICCARNQFLHLLTAAYDRNFRINQFLDDIAAMAASEESCSHNVTY